MTDLASQLPALLPGAIAWAEAEAAAARISGVALTPTELRIARSVGVMHGDDIRIVERALLPSPTDPSLSEAASQFGLLDPGTIGLTLGHAVFIVSGHRSTRLLSHEFRHVHQYERAGSISKFLRSYLLQILEYGYEQAPYEVDARAHEFDDA